MKLSGYSGKIAEFFCEADPGINRFGQYEVLNPVAAADVKGLIKSFCKQFYSGKNKRILMLGINPGRKGAGITGIPFTDPLALSDHCGIENPFKKERELSSTFIYEMITAFGGTKTFYDKVLLSAVCPFGFVKEGKNINYYDDPELVTSLMPVLKQSLKAQSQLNVKSDVVISLGKKNAYWIELLNKEIQLFSEVVVLEHPRFIMQYRRKSVNTFIDKYLKTISNF